jgi:ankyrin repeat protein
MPAALHDYVEIVELLLRSGADPNVFTDAEAEAEEGCGMSSALTLAVANGRVEVVRLLLRYGADIHAASSGGHTARDAVRRMMRFRHKPTEMAEILALLIKARSAP